MPLRLNNPGSTRIVDPTSQASRTATHLSTNIYILVNGIAVAAVKRMSIREERQIATIDEVGTDGHIDSAPKSSTNVTGSCSRTRYDRQRIAEAFGRGFVHLAAQRIPFDIEVQDSFTGTEDDAMVITTIRNVWMSSIEVDYNAEDFIIVDNMNWVAESVDSVLANGNPVVGAVNNRGIPLEINPFERQADTGIYRGALDASGLINAFDAPGGRVL